MVRRLWNFARADVMAVSWNDHASQAVAASKEHA